MNPTCLQIEPLLAPLEEGLLTRPETSAVEAHLRGCPECAAAVADARAARRALRDLCHPFRLPDEVWERIEATVTHRSGTALRRAERIDRWVPRFLRIAAVLFLAGIGFFLHSHRSALDLPTSPLHPMLGVMAARGDDMAFDLAHEISSVPPPARENR